MSRTFMITHIFEPMHLSISAKGWIVDASELMICDSGRKPLLYNYLYFSFAKIRKVSAGLVQSRLGG